MSSAYDKIYKVQNKQSHLRWQKGQPEILYQYRKIEGFWHIIKGDCIWATNARFSNDHEEQKLGIDLIKKHLSEGKGGEEWKDKLFEDCYIICFCGEDDKLSQWRGYGQNGVSIGFDFSTVRPFYIEKDEKQIEVYNGCGRVSYLKSDITAGKFKDEFSIEGKANGLYKEAIRALLPAIVPYIKHSGFSEEDEYRLAFIDAGLEEFVQYRENKGVMSPYIVVKAGKNEKLKDSTACLRLLLPYKEAKETEEIINKVKYDHNLKIETIICSEESDDCSMCQGCTRRRILDPLNYNNSWKKCKRDNDFYYCEEGDIYISDCKNQKDVFEIIYKELHKEMKDKAPKVWCEGHLPIRSITVGPSAQKALIKESIEHYCRHTYWLKDVDVRESQIPYRSE